MYSKTHSYIQPSSIWLFFQNFVADPFINGGYIFFALFLSTSITGSFYLSSFLMSSEPQFFLFIKYCLNHTIRLPTVPWIYCDVTNHPKICGGENNTIFFAHGFWTGLCSTMSESSTGKTKMVNGMNHLEVFSLLCLVPGPGVTYRLGSEKSLLEYMHMDSLYQLGFMKEWLKRKHPGTEHSRRTRQSLLRVLIQPHSWHILFVKTITSPPRFKEEGI